MPRAREIKILEPRQDSNRWPPKSLYSVSNGETLSAKLIFWSQESPNFIYRALNLRSAHAPPISKAIRSPSLIYSVVYMTLSWKPQWSKEQDTEKPKTSRRAHVLQNTLVHLVRCVYRNVKKVNYTSAFIRLPHLCITYLSFHAILTSLVKSPFLVWSVLIKCNAMDKKPFSLLWHFYLFMDSFIFIYLLLLLLLLFFWLAIFVFILHNFQRHFYHYQVTEPTEKRDILNLWSHNLWTKREDYAQSESSQHKWRHRCFHFGVCQLL